jgi:hypothetical protein
MKDYFVQIILKNPYDLNNDSQTVAGNISMRFTIPKDY